MEYSCRLDNIGLEMTLQRVLFWLEMWKNDFVLLNKLENDASSDSYCMSEESDISDSYSDAD